VDNNEVPSLRALLAAAATGDERSINELVRRYNALVCQITFRQLRLQGCNDCAGHSEEIIRAAWATIVMCGYRLEDDDRFKSWINTVISHLVSAHVSGDKGCISRQKRLVQLDPTHDAEIKDTKNVVEAGVWVNEMVAIAYKKSFLFGEIVRLHLVEGYTLEKVAAELNESYAKLRSFYYRNLKEFRQYFKDYSEEDDDGDDNGGGDYDSPYEN
jgi:DNA-directed RNA polymerase specialized sigma24 family protein